MTKQNAEIIDFVNKTTIAITVIAESTKSLEQTTGALKEMISAQANTNATAFEGLRGDSKVLNSKLDGLGQTLKYVVAPLVAGILGLVGVKLIWNL